MAEKKEKQYVSDNAQLMVEWDWEENNKVNLYPNEVTYGSTKKANWICTNGHHFSARIDHRTIMRSNCPYCAGKRPLIGVNDLAATHANLLHEWDYERNQQTPESYLAGSNKEVFWICKKCGHRWSARIISRAVKNTGCPVCAREQRRKTRIQGTIDNRGSLETEYPDLASEWDYKSNTPLTPADVHGSSKNKVWWIGKCGHAWQATITNRVAGNGCPICAGKLVLSGFNDLETKFPDIAKEMHPTLNEGLKPSILTAHNDRKVWWLCPNCGESYLTSIYSRTSLGTNCPICVNKIVRLGINDLSTTHPAIAKEWHPTKNGKLLPTDIVAGSNKKVWWCCEKDHEWKATVSDRSSGRGCPVCAQKTRPISRQKTYLEKNGSLIDNFPEIASQWHPTKNGVLSPSKVTAGSSALIWWLCEKGHEWEAVVSSRVAGRGCPYCNNERSSSYPEQILFFYLSKATTAINRFKLFGREIDIYLPDLNIGIEYNGRYYHQGREKQDDDKYQFFRQQGVRMIVVQEGSKMLIDGDTIHYQYMTCDYLNFDYVISAVFNACKLPICDIDISRDRSQIYEQYILIEKVNSLAEKYPWVVDEWDYEKNGKLTPWQVSYGSKKRINWICSQCGYRWEAVAHSRKKSGCPCCANRVVVKGINDLSTTHPHLTKEWDLARNENKPEDVVAGSHQYAWWVCQNGHSWRAQIKSRTQGCGCPVCRDKK